MERRVEKLEGEMHDAIRDIVDLKTRMAVAESNIKDIKADLASIKNNTTWIIRLIIGAIVLAILGFITQNGIGGL